MSPDPLFGSTQGVNPTLAQLMALRQQTQPTGGSVAARLAAIRAMLSGATGQIPITGRVPIGGGGLPSGSVNPMVGVPVGNTAPIFSGGGDPSTGNGGGGGSNAPGSSTGGTGTTGSGGGLMGSGPGAGALGLGLSSDETALGAAPIGTGGRLALSALGAALTPLGLISLVPTIAQAANLGIGLYNAYQANQAARAVTGRPASADPNTAFGLQRAGERSGSDPESSSAESDVGLAAEEGMGLAGPTGQVEMSDPMGLSEGGSGSGTAGAPGNDVGLAAEAGMGLAGPGEASATAPGNASMADVAAQIGASAAAGNVGVSDATTAPGVVGPASVEAAVNAGVGGDGGSGGSKHRGGWIYPTGRSREQTRRVLEGEFVVNPSAASKYGPLLEAINASEQPIFAGG